MNERILELELQAADGTVDPNGPFTAEEFNNFTKKFAELIVQECIDIIAPYSVRMSRPGEEYLHPIQEIREHFGVEE